MNDTIKLEFLSTFFKDEYFTNSIENKRNLNSKFLKNKELKGYWYIGEKNQNYFLVYNLDPYRMKEFIYQITEVQQRTIKLKGILTESFGDRITELETSL